MKDVKMSGSRIALGLVGLIIVVGQALGGSQAPSTTGDQSSARSDQASRLKGQPVMQTHYLEIVTTEVDAVCAAYEAALGVQFGKPDAGLGQARTAAMPSGGLMGVRAPLRDTEEPIVRPYWLVDDIEAAVKAAVKAGGQIAIPPLEIPGHGTFAIYVQGGVDHGLWQR